MAKAATEGPEELTPSWDFVKPSINLLRQNIDTLLWLAVLPAALALLASQLLSNIVGKYREQLSSNPSDREFSAILHKIAHELLHTTHGHVALAVFALGALWQLIIFPATISFMLRAARGEPADIVSSLKGGFGYFWRTFGITICISVVIIVGLILFIVPGFIFARRYILSPFYGMDHDVGVFEAMRLSAVDAKIYKSYIWGTLGVYAAFVFLSSLAGVIPVLGAAIGLIVGYFYYFGFALRYQSITAVTHKSTRSKK